MEEDSTLTQYLNINYGQKNIACVAVDQTGQFAALGGKKKLYIVPLNNIYDTYKSYANKSKYEIDRVQWCPHAEKAHMLASVISNEVSIWNIESSRKEPLYSLRGHTRPISDLSWSPSDANVLITGSSDKNVNMWDLREGTIKERVFTSQSSPVHSVQWNRKQPFKFASACDNSIHLWDIRKESSPIATITAHSGTICDIDWSHTSENILASSGMDKFVKVWSFDQPGQPPTSAFQFPVPISQVKFAPFGGLLTFSASTDYDIKLWNAVDFIEPIKVLSGSGDIIVSSDWREGEYDGEKRYQLVTWGKDQIMRMWPIEPETVESISEPRETVESSGTTQSVMTLDQELTLLRRKSTPHIYIDGANSTARYFEARVGMSPIAFRVRATFPPYYPNTVAPEFEISLIIDHTDAEALQWIDKHYNDIRLKGHEILTGTAESLIKNNRVCIENCLAQLLAFSTKLKQHGAEVVGGTASPSPPPSHTSPTPSVRQPSPVIHASDPQALVEEKPFSIKISRKEDEKLTKAMSLNLPKADNGKDSMLATSPLSGTSPRMKETNGISKFINNDYFSLGKKEEPKPGSSKSDDGKQTPKTFVESKPGSEGKKEVNKERFLSPRSQNEQPQIPAPRICSAIFSPTGTLVIVKPKRAVSDHPFGLFRSLVRTFDDWTTLLTNSQQTKQRARTPASVSSYYFSTDKDNYDDSTLEAYLQSNSVSLQLNVKVALHDASNLFLLNQYLASHYTLSGSTISEVCRKNAVVAAHAKRADLVKLWTILATQTDSSVYPGMLTYRDSTRVPWGSQPLGRKMVASLMQHYLNMHDVQTLAMVSAVLIGPIETGGVKRVLPTSEMSLHKAHQEQKRQPSHQNLYMSMPTNTNALRRNVSNPQFGSYTLNGAPDKIPHNVSHDDILSLQHVHYNHQLDSSESEDCCASGSVLTHWNFFSCVSQEHHKRLYSLLDPRYSDEYAQFIRCYADILYMWGEYNKRAELQKYVDVAELSEQCLEFGVVCSGCDTMLTNGLFCANCKKYGVDCSICGLSLKGSSAFCLNCGHGGHGNHIKVWFAENDFCATGCGCTCKDYM